MVISVKQYHFGSQEYKSLNKWEMNQQDHTDGIYNKCFCLRVGSCWLSFLQEIQPSFMQRRQRKLNRCVCVFVCVC